MDQRTKLAISAYALIYAATALVAFRFSDIVPLTTVYVLLSALFVIPIWLAVSGRVGPWLGAALLVATPLLPALIVVDPLEVGFYGYDPYGTLRDAIEFQSLGPLRLAQERFAWPGFYALLWVVTSVVGLPLETVGKFLPLIAVVTPLFLFLFARRLISTKTAFVAAIGFAALHTIYTFQVKFVDETPAFVMIFALILVLIIRENVRSKSAVSYLALAMAIGAVLTHHYVGALVGLWLVLWDLNRTELTVPSRFRDIEFPISRLTSITALVFLVMFLVVAPQFLGFVASVADLSPSVKNEGSEGRTTLGPGDGGSAGQATSPTQDGSEVSGSTGADRSTSVERYGELRFWKLVLANVLLMAFFGLVVLGYRYWTIEFESALLTGGMFAGILAVGYGYSVAFGPVIPLDPSRYLVYFVALILALAGYILNRSKITTLAFPSIVALFVVIQLAILPPALIYTDQEETILGEDHASPSQFSAGEWVNEFDGASVVGWEGGHWTYNGIRQLTFSEAGGDCSPIRVARSDALGRPYRTTDAVFYDNGRMQLFMCTR